jgi:CheY-like chemotaxis protein
MESRVPVLAVGPFDGARRHSLEQVAGEAAFDLVLAEGAQAAAEALEGCRPCAVLAAASELADQSLAVEIRRDPERAALPLIALADDNSDLAFANAFASGADDLTSLARPRSVIARLRAVPREPTAAPRSGRGAVLVADADRSRRAIVGRVLRNAGYSVTFAASAVDAAEFAKNQGLSIIVWSGDLAESPRSVVEATRAGGSDAIWIVTSTPRELRATREALSGIEGLAVADGYGPPENVLFLSNDLGRRDLANQRSSARLLYGTTVAFRGAGRDEDEFGYSYNVSEKGLYVRTLVAPADELLWLELRPPRAERRVRLVARCVWRRRFGRDERATVPAGFGVEIVDGAAADLAAFRSGYGTFASALG